MEVTIGLFPISVSFIYNEYIIWFYIHGGAESDGNAAITESCFSNQGVDQNTFSRLLAFFSRFVQHAVDLTGVLSLQNVT